MSITIRTGMRTTRLLTRQTRPGKDARHVVRRCAKMSGTTSEEIGNFDCMAVTASSNDKARASALADGA